MRVSPDENSYYVHELILQKKDNAPFKTGTVKNGTPGEASSPLFSLLKIVRDVKYDSEYFEAIERGDLDTAQRMVDEAAKDAGDTMPLYHGAKKGGGFTVFKDWQYFTGSKAYAERYI